jgi:hypothetical protein
MVRSNDVFERIELNTMELADAVRMTPAFKREIIERHGSDNLLMHLWGGHELEPRAMIANGEGWEMVSPEQNPS